LDGVTAFCIEFWTKRLGILLILALRAGVFLVAVV
jgi:hypothetical protein